MIFNLKKFHFFDNLNFCSLKIFTLNNFFFNAKFLTNYIKYRLNQGFYIYQISNNINKILSFFLNFNYLFGFKIAFKGRFSRKQRASFTWHRINKVSLSTKNS